MVRDVSLRNVMCTRKTPVACLKRRSKVQKGSVKRRRNPYRYYIVNISGQIIDVFSQRSSDRAEFCSEVASVSYLRIEMTDALIFCVVQLIKFNFDKTSFKNEKEHEPTALILTSCTC